MYIYIHTHTHTHIHTRTHTHTHTHTHIYIYIYIKEKSFERLFGFYLPVSKVFQVEIFKKELNLNLRSKI